MNFNRLVSKIGLSFLAVFISVLAVASTGKALLKVTGMTCVSCERAITTSLKKLDGVQEVSFRKGKDSKGVRVAEVQLKPGVEISSEALVEAVKKAGYSAIAE